MKNKNKLTIILLAISISIGALIAFFTINSNQNGGVVVAKVNGQKIRQIELENKINKMFGANNQNIELDQLPKPLIEALARDIYLQDELDKIVKKSAIAKDEKLQKQIAEYEKSILRQAYLEAEIAKQIDDQTIQNQYNELTAELNGKQEMHIKHILVEEEFDAKKIRSQIVRKTTSFENAAKKNSIDTSNADLGGDLGYVILENLDEDFAAAVQKLKKNQISDPIKTKFGWHVVKLEDIRDVKIPEFEEVKGTIEENLKQEVLEDIFKEITDDAEVEVLIAVKQQPVAEQSDEDKE